MMKKGPSNDVWMVRRKGKKVEETYEPFPSQQPTLIDTNCASKCNVQVDAQNMEPNHLLEFVKEQSHDNCGSAGLALAEDQTNKSVIHKQVNVQHSASNRVEVAGTVKEHFLRPGGTACMAPAAGS